jgi:hypothetical protein
MIVGFLVFRLFLRLIFGAVWGRMLPLLSESLGGSCLGSCFSPLFLDLMGLCCRQELWSGSRQSQTLFATCLVGRRNQLLFTSKPSMICHLSIYILDFVIASKFLYMFICMYKWQINTIVFCNINFIKYVHVELSRSWILPTFPCHPILCSHLLTPSFSPFFHS